MTTWELTIAAVSFLLGVGTVHAVQIIGDYWCQRPSGDPADRPTGKTRRSWPGAPKTDEEGTR